MPNNPRNATFICSIKNRRQTKKCEREKVSTRQRPLCIFALNECLERGDTRLIEKSLTFYGFVRKTSFRAWDRASEEEEEENRARSDQTSKTTLGRR